MSDKASIVGKDIINSCERAFNLNKMTRILVKIAFFHEDDNRIITDINAREVMFELRGLRGYPLGLIAA
jgi:hypothetical protein